MTNSIRQRNPRGGLLALIPLLIRFRQYGLNPLAALVALSLLTGCFDFSATIKKNHATFVKNFPAGLVTYEGLHRTMRMATSGDPHLPPILFIHGSPGGWDAWGAFLLNADLQKRFQLIAVDRPGYGGSGAGRPEYSLKNQAADIVLALRGNLSGAPAIVVGHSFGGPVAARLTMDYPEKVKSLILVAGAISPELERKKWYQIPAKWVLFSLFLPSDIDVCNREILALKSELELMLPKWKTIRAPVTVVQGLNDELVPPGNADFAEQMLTDAQPLNVIRIPGLNHFIPWLREDLITTVILKTPVFTTNVTTDLKTDVSASEKTVDQSL